MRRGVLITRPQPDASETAERVRGLGFVPVVAPVLAVEARDVAAAGRYDAVVVTSRNAVGSLPARLRGLPLLAVGSATAARARAAGFGTVLDAEGDAEALAGLALARLVAGSRVLFAHGAGQGDGLAAALQCGGFAVERRVAYAVSAAAELPEAARRALQRGDLRSAMFLSAETARAFVRLLPTGLRPHLERVEAVAIGAMAADVLALLPWHRVRVSVKPTLDEVLALI